MGIFQSNVSQPAQVDQNQQLIQNQEQIDISLLVDHPTFKKVFAIKNPVYLKKETLSIQKEAGNSNIFFIEFNYDAIYNFDLHIHFDVTKNKSGKNNLLPTNNYIPSYVPSEQFKDKSITISNMQAGYNIHFLEKVASFDIEYLQKNKTTNGTNNYDIVIEMVPLFEQENKNDHVDMAFFTLCKVITEDNEQHVSKIKVDLQRIRAHGMWIDVRDVFNCALETGECLICCSALRNTIFLPCHHSCTCNTCAHSLKMRSNPCPICKNEIEDLVILETDEEQKSQEDDSKVNIIGGEQRDVGAHQLNNNQHNNFIENDGLV